MQPASADSKEIVTNATATPSQRRRKARLELCAAGSTLFSRGRLDAPETANVGDHLSL